MSDCLGPRTAGKAAQENFSEQVTEACHFSLCGDGERLGSAAADAGTGGLVRKRDMPESEKQLLGMPAHSLAPVELSPSIRLTFRSHLHPNPSCQVSLLDSDLIPPLPFRFLLYWTAAGALSKCSSND